MCNSLSYVRATATFYSTSCVRATAMSNFISCVRATAMSNSISYYLSLRNIGQTLSYIKLYFRSAPVASSSFISFCINPLIIL